MSVRKICTFPVCVINHYLVFAEVLGRCSREVQNLQNSAQESQNFGSVAKAIVSVSKRKCFPGCSEADKYFHSHLT